MKTEKLEKLVADMEKTKNKLWKIEKKFLGFFKGLIVAGAEYAFMAWIFLWIYDTYGWEKTVITLAIGVILFGLRQRLDGGMKDLEIKELKAELFKLKARDVKCQKEF